MRLREGLHLGDEGTCWVGVPWSVDGGKKGDERSLRDTQGPQWKVISSGRSGEKSKGHCKDLL